MTVRSARARLLRTCALRQRRPTTSSHCDGAGAEPSAGMTALELSQLSPHLHRLGDTCNVYVLHVDSAALLIDAGSGAVADRIGELGIEQIEWVLHTHHHRDQSWGAGHLRG